MAGMTVRDALQEIVTSLIERIDHFQSPENERNRSILGPLFEDNFLSVLNGNINTVQQITKMLSEKIDIDAEVPSHG